MTLYEYLKGLNYSDYDAEVTVIAYYDGMDKFIPAEVMNDIHDYVNMEVDLK